MSEINALILPGESEYRLKFIAPIIQLKVMINGKKIPENPEIEFSLVEKPPVDTDDIAWQSESNTDIPPRIRRINAVIVNAQYIVSIVFAVAYTVGLIFSSLILTE